MTQRVPLLATAPGLAVAILLGPLVCGVLATILPAFGYLPALGGNTVTADHFHALFAMPGMGRSIMLSFCSGIVTTLVALTVVMLFVAGSHGTKSFARVQHLLSPLLAVPHAAAAFGLAFLIAPSGMIVRLLSPWLTGSTRPPDLLILQDAWGLSMMAGLIAKEIPFLLLVTLAALPQAQVEPARRLSQSFGYGRISGFVFTTWPRIYAQIRLAVFAVLAYATSVVDVAVILGPSTPSTLAVRLAQLMADPDIALRFVASAGALVQFVVTLAAIATWWLLERMAGAVMKRLRTRGARFSSDGAVRAGVFTLTAAIGAMLVAGLAILALWSVAGFWRFPDNLPQSFTLTNWTRALPALSGPLQSTLATGLLVTLIAAALALACLEREWRVGHRMGKKALVFIYLPLIVPQVSFVFGLQIFFLQLGYDGTFVALALVHLIFVLPYVFLSLSDPWRAWDPRYGLLAQGLGASPTKIFWRVRLPMVLKPLLTAAAVGFAVSIGQYLPTLLIGAGRWPSITTEAVALASGGNRRIIGVYAFVQMALPFVAFALAAAIPAFLFRHRRDMKAA
ncbi:MAG: ABC transporter permease [Pseudomonadota bacterium]